MMSLTVLKTISRLYIELLHLVKRSASDERDAKAKETGTAQSRMRAKGLVNRLCQVHRLPFMENPPH